MTNVGEQESTKKCVQMTHLLEILRELHPATPDHSHRGDCHICEAIVDAETQDFTSKLIQQEARTIERAQQSLGHIQTAFWQLALRHDLSCTCEDDRTVNTNYTGCAFCKFKEALSNGYKVFDDPS